MRASPPAVEIEHGERLQDIVELSRGELDGDILFVADLAHMLEVTYAVLIQDYPLDGKAGVVLGAHCCRKDKKRE